MVELGLALHGQQKHGDALVLLQRARSLCPFLPMLDLFLCQVQESAQKVGADVVAADVAAPTEHLVEGLLPTAWVEAAVQASSSGCQEQSLLQVLGRKFRTCPVHYINMPRLSTVCCKSTCP